MSEIVNRLRGQEPSITNYWGRTELEQIAATEIERLEAEVSRLTNLAQEGENRGLEKAAKIADDEPEYPDWGESNNLKYRHYTAKEIAMASCQTTKDCIAKKIRALIPQEQGEKGK